MARPIDDGSFIEQRVQKSCWGVTAWTVLALGGAFALIYILGGFDPTVIASR
jgi:hypothetical protein